VNLSRVANMLPTVGLVKEVTEDEDVVVDVVVGIIDAKKVQKQKSEAVVKVNRTPNLKRNHDDKEVGIIEAAVDVVEDVVAEVDTADDRDLRARDLETSRERTAMTIRRATVTREVVVDEIIPDGVQEDTDVAQDVPQHRAQEMKEVIIATTTTAVIRTTNDVTTDAMTDVMIVVMIDVTIVAVIVAIVVIVETEVIVKVIVMVVDRVEEDTVATERLSKAKKVTPVDPTMVAFAK